jgi:hypothetical protein
MFCRSVTEESLPRGVRRQLSRLPHPACQRLDGRAGFRTLRLPTVKNKCWPGRAAPLCRGSSTVCADCPCFAGQPRSVVRWFFALRCAVWKRREALALQRGPTLRCSRPATAGYVHLRRRLSSNVEAVKRLRASHSWIVFKGPTPCPAPDNRIQRVLGRRL